MSLTRFLSFSLYLDLFLGVGWGVGVNLTLRIAAPLPQTTDALEDGLKVPADIPAGDYVLSYRWDCEMTSQIWQSCADITIR